VGKVMDGMVDFVLETKYADFPAEVTNYSKKLVLSWLGAAMAGAVQPTAQIVSRFIKRQAGAPEAGVIGHRFRTWATDAALANGTMCHASELEDNCFPIGGPTMSVGASILSLAESLKASGKDFLEAFIIGWEIASRVTQCSPGLVERGFLPPSLLGGAAGAAKLLRLDAKKTAMALSISASYAHGLLRQTGSGAHLHEAGISAYGGLAAALLAREGLTGVPDIIECPRGLCSAWSGEGGYDLKSLVESLGNPYRVLDVGIKKYPCCWLEHRPIDGLLDLKKEYNLVPKDIESIEIHVGPYFTHLVHYPNPTTVEETRFSIEHSFAAVFLEKELRYNLVAYSEEKLLSPEYKELRSKLKIKVVVDDRSWAIGAGIDKIIVRLKDGKIFEKEVERPKGTPPFYLTNDEVQMKFESGAMFSKFLQRDQIEQVCHLVSRIDNLENIQNLMEIVTFGS